MFEVADVDSASIGKFSAPPSFAMAARTPAIDRDAIQGADAFWGKSENKEAKPEQAADSGPRYDASTPLVNNALENVDDGLNGASSNAMGFMSGMGQGISDMTGRAGTAALAAMALIRGSDLGGDDLTPEPDKEPENMMQVQAPEIGDPLVDKADPMAALNDQIKAAMHGVTSFMSQYGVDPREVNGDMVVAQNWNTAEASQALDALNQAKAAQAAAGAAV